jgi:curved DNA-binding protein CbpA
MRRDYYEYLGVSRDASTETIAAAYREKLKETHPDVSDATNAQERTKRLIEAKEVLTDEKERARYDRLGHEQYVARENADSSGAGDRADGSATSRPSGHESTRSSADGQKKSNGTRTDASNDRAKRGRARGWRQSGATEDFFDGWTETDPATGTDGDAGVSPEDFFDWTETDGTAAPGGATDPQDRRDDREATAGGGSETEAPEDFFDDWAARAEAAGTAAGDPTAETANATAGTADETTRQTTTDPAGATGTTTEEATTGYWTETATTESAGDRRTQSVDWYSGTDEEDSRQRNGSWDAMTHGIHSPWPGGGVAETYAVHRERDHTETESFISTDRVLFMIGFTFVIYPTLLFGALLPLFPISVRAIIATGALVVTAFLQSMPQIGLFVFGTWSVLIPVLLATTGLSVLAVEGLLLLAAVFFPFLFSLLTWLTVQPRSL